MDPWSQAAGGQATFAKQLIQVFGPRLAVAGMCNEAFPEGRWSDRCFDGHRIPFFSFGRLHAPRSSRPLIPARLQVYWRARRHMSRLYASGVRNILLESPELLFAASSFKWDSVCYSFAGVGNPVTNSRYRIARSLGPFFEHRMVAAFQRIGPKVLLAAADDQAISEWRKRTDDRLNQFPIYSFPTRVYTRTFYPESKTETRNRSTLPQDAA